MLDVEVRMTKRQECPLSRPHLGEVTILADVRLGNLRATSLQKLPLPVGEEEKKYCSLKVFPTVDHLRVYTSLHVQDALHIINGILIVQPSVPSQSPLAFPQTTFSFRKLLTFCSFPTKAWAVRLPRWLHSSMADVHKPQLLNHDICFLSKLVCR